MSQSSQPGAEPSKRAQDFAAVRDWPGYFRAVLGKGPRETLLAALDAFEREGKPPADAVDLACGEGRDSLELLRRGWRVHALDGSAEGLAHLVPRVLPEWRPRLRAEVATFDQMRWAKRGPVRLVNCSFSLPFCEPRHFDTVWERIVDSIEPGGRFAGQLFGDRDTWAAIPDRSHHAEPQARALLAPFEVEMFKVEEKDDADAFGVAKHWHVYHIVARKR
ncbi:MAG: class I SAM-dependent methyltransferase [Phycisphaerae bacterium]|nr:class I SAM-dependent methyltransferase [Phycisphaerae bacterium]